MTNSLRCLYTSSSRSHSFADSVTSALPTSKDFFAVSMTTGTAGCGTVAPGKGSAQL